MSGVDEEQASGLQCFERLLANARILSTCPNESYRASPI